MNSNELKAAIVEALQEYVSPPRQPTPPPKKRKRKIEFSKLLMIFAVLLCGGTWIVATTAWILWREFPTELVEYTGWFLGAIIAYMFKSGYENKSKIMRREDENG